MENTKEPRKYQVAEIQLTYKSNVKPSLRPRITSSKDAYKYYRDVIGVTVNDGNRPQTVHLAIDRTNAPYVITKPLHHTQKVVAKSTAGIEITIDVILNYELEREILGFGECITVIKPLKLRERIQKKLEHAVERYTAK